MTVIDLAQVPNSVVVDIVGNTGLFPSPLIASAQTIDRGGLKWMFTYTWTALRNNSRADLMGTVVALRSQENRLRVPVYDNPKQGAYGGTPLVDGASQTGSSIDIKGCDNNVTNWIRKGDYISFIVNAEPELKMCTADASSDGSGLISGLSFEPRLRDSPADSAVIYVEDGVLSKPKGIFLLANPKQAWSSRPGEPSKVTSITLQMIEDVFATQ